MKAVIKWTPFALRCLDEIHFYISQETGSFVPAEKFVNLLFDRVGQLSDFPQSGSVETILLSKGIECRYLIEGNYKIIYEHILNPSSIIILDIFHTSQNPDKINTNY
jgi:toxin ParE1/3/4